MQPGPLKALVKAPKTPKPQGTDAEIWVITDYKSKSMGEVM